MLPNNCEIDAKHSKEDKKDLNSDFYKRKGKVSHSIN